MKKLCALAAALFIAEAGDGLAQEQQSFKTIMGKGYEIKNGTFARGEATENREIVLVTLQKDKSVAVCYFASSAAKAETEIPEPVVMGPRNGVPATRASRGAPRGDDSYTDSSTGFGINLSPRAAPPISP